MAEQDEDEDESQPSRSSSSRSWMDKLTDLQKFLVALTAVVIALGGLIAAVYGIAQIVSKAVTAAPLPSAVASPTQLISAGATPLPTASPNVEVTEAAAVRGAIVQPASGASISSKTFLPASGTAANVPADSRIWIFIEWKGVSTYWATDPKDISYKNGRWSGKIYVGDPGDLLLWLVDLGPHALNVLNTDVTGQNNGFDTLKLASDARTLASVPFTATSNSKTPSASGTHSQASAHKGARTHEAVEVSGAILQPASGASISSKTFLPASGTAANVPADSRIWIFIEWEGVPTYWATDPKDISYKNGRWSGKIYVGDPGNLLLWLVDLGPHALNVLNTDVTGQNNGFDTLKLASDARILASVPFTAN